MSNMNTYIMKTNVSPYYKIGKSIDIERRKSQIKGSVSFIDVQVVHSFPLDIEAELHAMYAAFRVKGEWFELSQEQIEQIRRIDGEKAKAYFIDTEDMLFTPDALELYFTLSPNAKELLWHLTLNIKKDSTIIYFSKWDYMIHVKLKSVKPIEVALEELEKAQVILRSHKVNWFWCNPKYLFRGSMTRLIKSINSKKPQRSV